jgi:hypothetical protein
MKIETKYNIGDKVWYLDSDNKPLPKIKEMSINKILTLSGGSKENNIFIYYNGWETEDWQNIPEKLKEENLFKTKEELIASL